MIDPNLTATENLERQAPAKKRGGWPKGKKRARRAQADPPKAKPVAVPSEFAGLSETDCCDACCLDRCVITGMAVCGHPFKGGLQPALMSKPDVLKRFERAKKAIAHRRIDLTGL